MPIRLAAESDRPAVEAIVRAAYAGYIPRIGRPPGPMLDDYAARIRDGQVHVLDCDGVVRGVLVLIPQPDALLLDNIAVDPAMQGKGYGKQLMAFAEDVAAGQGKGLVRLYTHEKMMENIALYGRLGFAEVRRVEEYGFRRVYMEKRIGSTAP